jgi:hypothetical protein
MKKWVLFFLVVSMSSNLKPQAVQHPLLPSTWDIKSEELLDIVRELAKPEYEGRLTGSPGFRKAADFLAAEFERLGLTKPFAQDGYFQKFTIPYTVVLPDGSISMVQEGIEKAYRYYDEFMPGSTSGSGDLTAGVLFAGYGITAPELGYDDYQGIDVKGKIVLIRPEAPVSPGAGPEKFDPWLPYSLHQYKMKNALAHGARGVLYHYGPLANTNNDYHPDLLLTMVSNRVVEDLFAGTGRSYGAVVSGIEKDLKPKSFELKKNVRIKNKTIHFPAAEGMNVVGVLPGSDPVLKNEVILIGGHLDHCGQCWEVCPGANDNASGIAVMVGVARALVRSGITFNRTIVFIGIGGEESGLVGAKRYVSAPLFPKDSTLGLINLDCVGVGPNLHAGGGMSFPAFFGPIEAANINFVHRTLGTSAAGGGGRPRSDSAIFSQAGIPSISFSSYGGSGGYHTPADTPETIWPETLEDLATILTIGLADLAGIHQKN